MDRLELTAVNRHGEVIKCRCALSLTYQKIVFSYKGTHHEIKYTQTKKGCYFILGGIRYYFKVWDNFYNKWAIDCNCF